MNLIEIAGYLGSDAEERFTPNGKKVISFRMATRTRQGGKDETIWWKVNIWGDRFDKMVPYLRKGTAIIVLGEMNKPETYVDKEGKTQVVLTVNAEIVKFSPFGKPDKGQESGSAGVSHQSAYTEDQGKEMAGKTSYGSHAFADFSNDDLPF